MAGAPRGERGAQRDVRVMRGYECLCRNRPAFVRPRRHGVGLGPPVGVDDLLVEGHRQVGGPGHAEPQRPLRFDDLPDPCADDARKHLLAAESSRRTSTQTVLPDFAPRRQLDPWVAWRCGAQGGGGRGRPSWRRGPGRGVLVVGRALSTSFIVVVGDVGRRPSPRPPPSAISPTETDGTRRRRPSQRASIPCGAARGTMGNLLGVGVVVGPARRGEPAIAGSRCEVCAYRAFSIVRRGRSAAGST